MPHSFKESLQLYLDKRMLWIFIMGICSGFPWALIGSNLSGWLKDVGISRGDIGAIGVITAIYALNFLWAPLLDRYYPPLFSRFGNRRGWLLFMQSIMLIALVVMSTVNPALELTVFVVLALIIASCSATQDIAIDAFRIDQFSENESDKLPAATSMSLIGWWTGYSGPGYIAFSNADATGWNDVYKLMIGILLILMLAIIAIGESSHSKTEHNPTHSNQAFTIEALKTWVYEVMIKPFEEFFSRNGVRIAITLLLFIFLFKIGEAFLGKMSLQFYKEIGFSNEQIATYSKGFGWILSVCFILLGSLFNTRFGVVQGLIIGGIAMASSNLMYALMANAGPVESLFLVTLIIDNFTAAFSSVAFISFLSAITGKAFSASQYALLASVGNFGRTSLAGVSGYTVDWLGSWELFFIMTAIMVLPSLLLLFSIRKKLIKIIQSD